jgi:DNA-binding response OmpR family regulator
MKPQQSLLVVESNPEVTFLIEKYLTGSSSYKYVFSIINSLSGAQQELSQDNFNAVILDISLPDNQGFETLEKVKEYTQKLAVIVLTGNHDNTTGRIITLSMPCTAKQLWNGLKKQHKHFATEKDALKWFKENS